MAGDSSNDRFGGAKKLLDYGFANYNYSSIDAGLEENTELDVIKGTEKTVGIKPQSTLNILLPKTASGKVERKTVLNENVTAPVKKGDVLGTVTVTLDGEQLGEIPLVAEEDVPKLTLGVTLGWILKGLFQL